MRKVRYNTGRVTYRRGRVTTTNVEDGPNVAGRVTGTYRREVGNWGGYHD